MPLENFSVSEAATSVRNKINAAINRVNAIDDENAASNTDGSITWRAGNTLTRVEAVLSGGTFVFLMRAGGSPSINPAGPSGSSSWFLENPSFMRFYPSLGPYLLVGHLVFYQGRMYQLLSNYSTPPTEGTDAQWKDIYADADSGNTEGTIDPVDPANPVVSDGALTTAAFATYDLSQFSTNAPGSSGQVWTQSTAIAGSTGQGYSVASEPVSTQATGAVLTVSNIGFENTVDKKIWLRLHGASALHVGACSHTRGSYSIQNKSTEGWEWVQSFATFAALDREFRLFGLDPNLAMDKMILTETSNSVVPTGQDGFKAS